MFGFLGGQNKARIPRIGVFPGVLDHAFGLGDKSFHGFALLGLRGFAQQFENPLQPFDLACGLFDVFLESGGQLRAGGGFFHLFESGRKVFLGPVDVFDLVEEEFAEVGRIGVFVSLGVHNVSF